MPIAEEPPDWLYHATTLSMIVILMAIYAFGSWLRTYIAPPDTRSLPVPRQLAISVPAGLLTMPFYAKNAFPSLSFASKSLMFDVCSMVGFILVMGMLSRETLDRALKLFHSDAADNPAHPSGDEIRD